MKKKDKEKEKDDLRSSNSTRAGWEREEFSREREFIDNKIEVLKRHIENVWKIGEKILIDEYMPIRRARE